MEHSPFSEANSLSASQETIHILCNLTVHYHIYNSLPPVSILSHSIQSLLPHLQPSNLFLEDNCNIASHLFLGVQSGLFPESCPTQKLYAPLTFPFPHIGHTTSLSNSDHEAPHHAIFSTPLLPHPF